MPTYTPLVFNYRKLCLHKAIVTPALGARTVLTNEPWNFVEMSLARHKMDVAQFYWQQAKEFYTAALGLPLRSAPLPLYYAFMNSVKALLASKCIHFDERHGVRNWKPSNVTPPIGLSSGVRILKKGILPSLSSYYGEKEPNETHTLDAILFNLPFVHRTYCLTYTHQVEMFVPLIEPQFVIEDGTTHAFFTGALSTNYPLNDYITKLPATLKSRPDSKIGTLISTDFATVTSVQSPTTSDLTAVTALARSLRDDIYYINGAETLWYVKTHPTGQDRLLRQTTTLTLAAMHRLSELCRYDPRELARQLGGPENWLLSEFITMAGQQFIDEIASEITGQQCQIPNIRRAT